MHHLPTGTVTLLFADIEGSTHLLQRLGKQYGNLLVQCRQLLHATFQQWNGHEVDTQGDSVFVAFARATDALAAAVDAQRALAAHGWPDGVSVRVRMGLHTGEPLLSAENYVGLDVHRAARIMSAGHGGQVLLSQTTRDLVEHDLPTGVSLRDLGAYRLKDLQQKSHLYQLAIAGLQASFPPLKTLDTRPHNLPIQPTPFLGREKDVALVHNLLCREEVRLFTLTGCGGIGKTRMALQVAAELSERFADGVFFVNLAPISDPTFVVPTIAQTLDLKETGEQPLLDLLKVSLRDRQLLLLLDNFEQVLGAASQLADLLAACPKLKVVVTSRAVLHVRGEQEFAVPPLTVPDPKHLPDLVALSQYEAVALFISRAQEVKPDFQVTNASAPAIAEICTRLDGLPLAIELAAARIKLLPPQALLARLGQRLAVLTSGARDAPARQQTLRNTIAWSYHLLDDEEQRLFRQLSVFAGGCTLEAVEAVCTGLPDGTGLVFDGVASLLDKSLLQQTENEGGEPRLSMLETIREYGLEVLAASGEMELTRRAHALYYLALTEKAEPLLFGVEQGRWLDRLEQEHDNVRAVLQWLFEQEESERDTEMALRLSSALRRFWSARGHGKEGRDLLERALATSKGATVSVRVKGLNAAGWLALSQGDTGRAEALAQESLTLCREVRDIGGIAHSFVLLGAIAFSRGNLVAARSQTEESVALFRKLEDKTNIAWSLSSLAAPVAAQGEYTKARALLEESVALFQELGDKRGLASSLFDLAWVLFLSHGEPAMVRRLLEQGLKLYREIGHGSGTAESLSALARVTAAQGDHTEARTLYEESLTIAGKLGDKVQIASILEQLGEVIAVHGEFTRTARLWGAAEALRDAMGAPLPPVYRAEYEQAVVAVRSALGEKAFAAAWAEGRTMTPEQVLAAQEKTMVPAAGSTGKLTSPNKPQATYPDGLTAREVEVLCLVAQGLTDAQVAEQLVISPRTVNTHLKSIYGKIGVTSRSAATRYAMEHQLV